MLKKILLLLIFSLLTFHYNLQLVDAFLDEDSSLDLYNNIDDWIYKLELKNYEVNLTYDWKISIASRINEIVWTNCIDESITIEDFKLIAGWDTNTLNKFIKNECKEENWEYIKTSVFNNYFNVISKLDIKSTSDSEEKTKIIYNIARLWLYSDWDKKNSPYDIINDLEGINWVIFTLTDDTKYKWTNDTKLSDYLWWSSSSSSSSSNSSSSNSSSSNTCDTSSNSSSYINWFACSNTTSKNLSWLNYSSIIKVLNTIDSNWDYSTYNGGSTNSSWGTNCWTGNNSSSWNTTNNWWTTWSAGWWWSASSNDLELISPTSSDINSDSSDCDDFFCIKVLYKKSEHSLFWWSNKKDSSVAWVIKNSNNHLYKYASTSLIQHQLTLDNWELSIKELKLKDILNLNYIVFYREIPIINSWTNKEKEKKVKENNPFSKKNLLQYYFNLYWIEYDRANSIDDFLKTLEESKALQDSAEWQVLDVSNKYNQFTKQSALDKDSEKELNKLLSTKQRVNNVDYLYGLFIELSSFTTTFEIYVQWLNIEINKMNKKPTS